MAAVLSRNMTDIKEITNFTEECKRMNLKVLGPDINESDLQFVVNKKGEIRFGMAGIKNVGEAAAQSIIDEREKAGTYADIIEFVKRIDLRAVNKRSMESLAKAGAFDCFPETHRAQYFHHQNGDESIFLEKLLKYANDIQVRKSAQQHSLFGGEDSVMLPQIEIPQCEPWSNIEQLKHEKDIIGFYMTGHPLDNFRLEMDSLCNVTISEVKADMKLFKGREFTFAGMVSESSIKIGKSGKQYGFFTVEDHFDSISMSLFSEEFLKLGHLLKPGTFVFIKARVDSRYDAADQLVVKIISMILLEDALEKNAKSIMLMTSNSDITREFVANIAQLAKKHKGKAPLRIQVRDEDERLSIDLPSRKFRVDIKEFALEVGKIPELSFKIS